ncbi:DUF3895 domain-containing protein [Alkalihalobacillus sp. MEB130]|uniref:DUF3895 domain-containing protein n=1 Tax=Alkalihalobacillus sp. MEB130 TaxID=2976704 RepID=UPI0028E08A6A|nr:DUF3895 domain-containing protein [Alkalihalobacillus sp. MEB130]MDT8861344.1 DUF3895 domain-containing protein [Alkalihalobacillus sp. MEB130]
MLSTKETELIKEYITRNQLFHLTELCEYLIENGSSSQTYSTGRYKIYPYAAIYLESLQASIEMDITLTEKNVRYKVKNPISITTEEKEEKKEVKIEKEEDGMEQLSLF